MRDAFLPPRLADMLLLWLLAGLWGGSYSLIRVGLESLPPVTLMAARTAIAAVLLLVLLRWWGIRLGRNPAEWRRFAVQGVLNSVVPWLLLAWGQRQVPAGLAAILNSSAPVFTFAATWLMTGRETGHKRKLLGVAVGLGGNLLVLGGGSLAAEGSWLAALAIVLATICYAGAALHGRHFSAMHPARPAAGSMVCAAVILLPLAGVVDRPWTLSPSSTSLIALVVLAVFSTALALVIYFRLARTLGPVGVAAQSYLRVPIGVAAGVVFLGETLTPAAVAGLACVVMGVAAITLPDRPDPSAAPSRSRPGKARDSGPA